MVLNSSDPLHFIDRSVIALSLSHCETSRHRLSPSAKALFRRRKKSLWELRLYLEKLILKVLSPLKMKNHCGLCLIDRQHSIRTDMLQLSQSPSKCLQSRLADVAVKKKVCLPCCYARQWNKRRRANRPCVV